MNDEVLAYNDEVFAKMMTYQHKSQTIRIHDQLPADKVSA